MQFAQSILGSYGEAIGAGPGVDDQTRQQFVSYEVRKYRIGMGGTVGSLGRVVWTEELATAAEQGADAVFRSLLGLPQRLPPVLNPGPVTRAEFDALVKRVEAMELPTTAR